MDNKNKENVEQSILVAAEEEFLTKGFNGAKTTEIARKAGVTHAMLHYYFRTKENLFDVVVNKKIEILQSMVRETLDLPNTDFIDKVRYMVGRHFDFGHQHLDIPRFIINEVMMKPDFSVKS